MRFHFGFLVSSIFIIPSLASSLYLTVPASNVLPSPASLLPSTHATLTKANLTLSALLRRENLFKFSDIPHGSYLCDIYSRDYSFAPLRIDVNRQGVVEVYQTFRGNEWDNKGERLGAGVDVNVNVRVLTEKNFYESRGGFSLLGLLKNPMILIGIFGMGMMIGMPYLLDNMDPEMKKEFEEQQKSSPLAGVTSGGGPMQGFDMAAWMAGKTAPSSSAEEKSVEAPKPKSKKRG